MPRYSNATAGKISVRERVGKTTTYKLLTFGEEIECSEETAQPYVDRGRLVLVTPRPFHPIG